MMLSSRQNCSKFLKLAYKKILILFSYESFRRLTIWKDFLFDLAESLRFGRLCPPSAPACHSEALEESAQVGAQIQRKSTLVIEQNICHSERISTAEIPPENKKYFQ